MATQNRSKAFDWVFLSLYLSLIAIGVLMQYATYYNPDSASFFSASSMFTNQLIWTGIALVFFLLCLLLDWKIWTGLAYLVYGFCLFLLLMVLFVGTEIKGAKSWIMIGPYSIQPSEIAKFGTALGLSNFLASIKGDFKSRSEIFVAVLMCFFPLCLIMLQPDAGSALVFVSLFLLFYKKGLNPMFYFIGALFVATFILSLIYSPKLVIVITLSIVTSIFFFRTVLGILGILLPIALAVTSYFLYKNIYFVLALILASVVMAIVYFIRERDIRFTAQLTTIMASTSMLAFGTKYFFDHILEPHQQDRINVWLRPYLCDPRGSLYNITQSKIAIGSGGLEGRGFLQGALTRYNYVPEQSTDFIFTVVGEEQGFIGAITVIIIYAFLILKTLQIGERAQTPFIGNYAYAIAGFLIIHFFVNIGMTLGLMPVIGIPLPFISKGGSSILMFSIMLGVLLNMDRARNTR